MFINPKTAIEEGWITFPEWMDSDFRAKCIQPNAIDITADKMFDVNGSGDPKFLSENNGKNMCANLEIHPGFPLYRSLPEPMWELFDGQVYDVMSDFYVEVPEGVAASLIIRSTLNRCGIALNAGLYDSGFKGNIGMVLFNRMITSFWLAPHTRVCQIIFTASDSNGVYSGGYNTERGKHWKTTQSTGPH